MFEKQNHRCAICDTEIHDIAGENDVNRGVVDHCHQSNKIRGLLCHHCNRALGLMKDSKENIKRMLEYLN